MSQSCWVWGGLVKETLRLLSRFIPVILVHDGKDQDVDWTIRTAQIHENWRSHDLQIA